MKTLNIDNCSYCPFFSDTFACCELKPQIENRIMCEDDKILYDEKEGRVIPEWCPLRVDAVLVKLNQPDVVKSFCDKCKFENECRFKAENVEHNCKFFIQK